MKTLLATAAFTLIAISGYAQPARDIVDASAAARQHVRDIEPALTLMRSEADALAKINEIQRALSGPPLSSIDRAFHIIDDYSTGVGRRGLNLPRDQQNIVMHAQRMLQDAHTVTPNDYARFRDDFHHEIQLPMQFSVARDLQQIMSLTNIYTQLTNSLRGLENATVNAINGAAIDSTRQ
ncbi:MAG TPA: hypothetical protein VNN08_18490 [Thermoanaerobaculia bacterium]|nr:hypothetical protein [Thermoanaerobaculia bacterium]